MATTNKPSANGRFSQHVELKGSLRQVPPGKKLGPLNSGEIIEVTVRLRRKNAVEDYVQKLGKGNDTLTLEEFDKKFGASDKDIAQVEEYAHEHDLTVVSASVSRRSVILK